MSELDKYITAQSAQNERRSCRHCGEQYWTLDAAHRCVGSVIDELMSERRMVEIERAAAERCAGERDALRAERDEAIERLALFRKLASEDAMKLQAERDTALARVKELESKAEFADAMFSACCYLDKAVLVYGMDNPARVRRAADLVVELRVDNERLRGLVKSAFEEGVREGWYNPDELITHLWEASQSRKELSQ